MISIRRNGLEALTKWYVKVFNEKDVPHIYATAAYSVFDASYVLGVAVIFEYNFTRLQAIIVIVTLFLANQLVYRRFKPSNKDYFLIRAAYFVFGPLFLVLTVINK